MNAVSLVESELPLVLAERSDLARRLYSRGGDREFQFHYRDPVPLLPVILGGRLELVAWGNRDRSVELPFTAWTWLETVEAGRWAAYAPEPVDIPGTYGLEGGVWFRVKQGFRGLLVRDGDDVPHVYPICVQPTRYYRIMTRGTLMPCLIDEVI